MIIGACGRGRSDYYDDGDEQTDDGADGNDDDRPR